MKEQHFIIYRNEHTENRHGQNEVLQTLRVEQVMADGKRKTVYADIQFHNDSVSPELCGVFKRIVSKQWERRAWRSGRGAA